MAGSITSRATQVSHISAIVVAALSLMACGDASSPTGTNVALGRRLIAGEKVACALNGDAVYCWGHNSSYWEYGVAPATLAGIGSPLPAQVPALSSLALGVGTHFCGMTADKSAVCWARGQFGELGTGLTAAGNPAAVVQGGIRWADISVGRLSTCGISDAGVGYCWGLNQRGEVGSASTDLGTSTLLPVAVDGGHIFKSIAAAWVHACGILTSGVAYCWGGNTAGELGIGSADTVAQRTPTPVSGGLTFAQLSLGSLYTCGLTTDGAAYCWGENSAGQLGDGTRTSRSVPTRVGGGFTFSQIVASSGFGDGAYASLPTTIQGGSGHTCALTTNGRAYCWGWNGNGELGDGTTVDRLTPTAVSGDLTFNTLAVGGAYSCGMQVSRVWCWGSNLNGQIGKGQDTSPALLPAAVLQPFNQ